MMELIKRNQQAINGMANAIYLALKEELEDSITDAFEEAKFKDENEKKEKIKNALDKAEETWNKLSNAIAKGVVGYITKEPDETVFAQSYSSKEQDQAFWSWFLNFTTELEEWSNDNSATTDQLKMNLVKFFKENTTPTSIKGVIQW